MFDDGWTWGARRVAAAVAAVLPDAATVADLSDEAVLDAMAGLELARRLLDAAQLEQIAELSRRAHARHPMFDHADHCGHCGRAGRCGRCGRPDADDGPARALPGRPVPGEFAAEEVAVALGIGPAAALRRVALAGDLEQRLPVVFDALAAGRVDLPRARLIRDQTAALPEACAQTVAAGVLADLPRLSWTGLETRLKADAMAADPAAAAERARRARRDRHAWATRAEDGSVGLGARLPVVDAALAWTGLTHAATTLQQAARRAGEPLTLDQARADALAAALAGLPDTAAAPAAAPAAAAGEPSSAGTTRAPCAVNLTLPLATLLGHAAGPGEIGGRGVREPVDADTARRAALALLGHGAPLRLVALYPDGTAAAATAATTRVPARIADLVAARDRTCRFPLCTRPADTCDIDHTVPTPHGATELANLSALCRRHHRLKTHTAWLLKQTDPGVLLWTTPTGRQVTTQPQAWPRRTTPPPAEPPTPQTCTDTLWQTVLADIAADPPDPVREPPHDSDAIPDTHPWDDTPPWEHPALAYSGGGPSPLP